MCSCKYIYTHTPTHFLYILLFLLFVDFFIGEAKDGSHWSAEPLLARALALSPQALPGKGVGGWGRGEEGFERICWNGF